MPRDDSASLRATGVPTLAETERRSGPVNLIWVMPAEGVARETFDPRHRAVRRGLDRRGRAVAGPTRRATACPSRSTGRRTPTTPASTWPQKLGYYRAAGIDLKILPYASTAPETLVSHRKADFGFSYSAGVAFARAAGADVTSVFAVLQHTALEIGVRADRTDIRTPKDLDGKTYAGFGTPDEKPLLQTVIRHAGGTGVVQGRHAQHVRLRRRLPRQGRLHAAARDLGGHPGAARRQAAQDVQALALRRAARVLRADRLEQRATCRRIRALARRFLAATTRGYQYAADHPRAAARILIAHEQAGADAAAARLRERRPDGAGATTRTPRGDVGHADARRLEGLRGLPLRASAR